jgi:hypothetical protein
VEALEDLAAGRSRMAMTCVEERGTRMEYATRKRFCGLGRKTTGGRFLVLGLKTQAKVPRRNGVAHGGMIEVASG